MLILNRAVFSPLLHADLRACQSFLKPSGPCQQDFRRVPGLAFFCAMVNYITSTSLKSFIIFQACLERCNSKQLSLRLSEGVHEMLTV